MNVYRRYFKVTTGPLVAALQQHREVMKQAHAEYEAICKEIGADVGKFYQRDGKLVGFIFSGNPGPDPMLFKEGNFGWTPRKNTKRGKAIAKQVDAVKTRDVKECLKAVGLANHLARIFSNSKAYGVTIIDIPDDTPWALIAVPWYDENPDTLAQYKVDREKHHFNANLDAILWEPTPDMVELKEWQYKKEIDDWNESVKAKKAA